LSPVNQYETGAIFVGQGHFTLKPVGRLDTQEMMRRSGSEIAEEDFTEAVFRFSPGVYQQFSGLIGKRVDTPSEAAVVFQLWKSKVRYRHEVPEGFTQAVLEDANIDNVDADVLAAVYNPKHPPFLNAYMVGKPHKDLRFFVRMRVGAIRQLDSPEEVALINCSGGGTDDGIWYSNHRLSELKAGSANSNEERRLFATKRYNIETVIGKNNHFFSRATITFVPLVEGERVLKFGLVPTLRVTRVSDENGKDLHFIQEGKKEDGSFYAILDGVLPLGQEHSITAEYTGDKVLYDAGGGSYYVGARESWYPNLNGFGEKALYDLTFKVPKSNVVISVGKLHKNGFSRHHHSLQLLRILPDGIARQPEAVSKWPVGSDGSPQDDRVCPRSGARPNAALHNLLWQGPLRQCGHHGAAELQLWPVVAEPGVLADLCLHRFNTALDALWPHR